jgi:VanZ family protein
MHENTTSLSFRRYWKSIIWAIIMAIGLFTPGDKLTERKFFHIEHFDKILHFLIFGFLQFLILFDMHLSQVIISRRHIFASSLICIFYGIVTEIVQFLFVSEREGSIYDLLADIIGILLSILFFFLIRDFIDRWFHRKL